LLLQKTAILPKAAILQKTAILPKILFQALYACLLKELFREESRKLQINDESAAIDAISGTDLSCWGLQVRANRTLEFVDDPRLARWILENSGPHGHILAAHRLPRQLLARLEGKLDLLANVIPYFW